jgi:probable F420-dependent oxidoreductase
MSPSPPSALSRQRQLHNIEIVSPVNLGFQVLSSGPLATPEHMVEMARTAERLGYDSFTVTDHVVIPRQYTSRYPYAPSGRLRAEPDEDYYEALTLLSFLAGATTRIRFGPSVLVLPHRNPVLTAKMLATLDALSGGRLFVAVGVGWLEEEFTALGTPPFPHRGAVTDEWIEIFQAIWTKADPAFTGRFYHVPSIGVSPRPVQKPHPPILVGGNTRPAIRRAARYATGWHALKIAPAELPPFLAYLREQLRAQGRAEDACGLSGRYGARVVGPRGDRARRAGEDPGKVFVGTAGDVIEQLRPLLALGPTEVAFDCRTGSYDEVMETMQRLAEEVWPKVQP